ncbi:MAG TPA: type II toxin-antitoxin system RelE/ParE family toxin [Spirochaetales bacterium]|nr:type II toxin-antitoxin system RelE/ParE family toxin [Spirochaetales bacterium]
MFEVKLTRLAAERLARIEAGARRQIVARLEELKAEPLKLGKPLKGPLKDYRSLRAAGQRYRIVYRVFENRIVVVVVAVGIRKEGDRGDIYELMKKLVRAGLLDLPEENP